MTNDQPYAEDQSDTANPARLLGADGQPIERVVGFDLRPRRQAKQKGEAKNA